jgi:hypothetical protein
MEKSNRQTRRIIVAFADWFSMLNVLLEPAKSLPKGRTMLSPRFGLSVFTLFLCAALPIVSGEKKKDEVPFEIYAKGYFVKNTVKLPGDKAFLVLHDKKAYDEIFGIGFVMGAKPKLVDERLFEKNLVVTVIKSGNTLWKYEVEKVRVDKKQLIVEYKATGKEAAGAKYSVPLIVSAPRSEITEVIFIENGKEAGKAEVKK